jgi:endonuclease YncB( thermonuclease family)
MKLASYLAILFFAATALLGAQTITGRVVQVSDGDTITVLAPGNRQVRVHLAWVDAPERGQAFANASRQSLNELVAGRTVHVIVRDNDRYGRTVGTVEVDGLDVSLEQLQLGLAWVFERYITDAPAETRREYREVQELARWERKGLWKDKDAIPPWEFREARRLVR